MSFQAIFEQYPDLLIHIHYKENNGQDSQHNDSVWFAKNITFKNNIWVEVYT